MIIYYHCTSNNPLLLSFTNLPSIHPLSFHERIFYTCSTRRAALASLVMRMRNKKMKMTTPSRRRQDRDGLVNVHTVLYITYWVDM